MGSENKDSKNERINMKRRKKRIFIIVILIVLLGIGWWYLFLGSRITDVSNEMISGEDGTRSLVVFFSRSGEIADTVDAMTSATPNSNQAMEGSDTEAAAKMIQELTGADLYQIRTERYYRSAFWGTAATAWIEEALNLRPELAAQPEDLDDYDVIYVGYPTWWYTMALAVLSFLKSCDWNGKTVIPFQTHGGWPGHVMKDMNKVCKGAAFTHEMKVQFDSSGGSELVTEDAKIEAWIEQIKKAEF